MVGQHHQLNGHESEQTLRDSEGQRSLECYNPLGHKGPDTTQQLNNNHLNTLEMNNFKKQICRISPTSATTWLQSWAGLPLTLVMIHLARRQQDPGRHSAHRCCMLQVLVSGLTEPPPHPYSVRVGGAGLGCEVAWPASFHCPSPPSPPTRACSLIFFPVGPLHPLPI